jgi:hypothetical protein
VAELTAVMIMVSINSFSWKFLGGLRAGSWQSSGVMIAAAHVVGEIGSECLALASYRFMGDDNTALGEEQLDIPQAEAEDVVQPDGMADDLDRKPMAIRWVGWRFMPPISPASGHAARPGYSDNASRRHHSGTQSGGTA